MLIVDDPMVVTEQEEVVVVVAAASPFCRDRAVDLDIHVLDVVVAGAEVEWCLQEVVSDHMPAEAILRDKEVVMEELDHNHTEAVLQEVHILVVSTFSWYVFLQKHVLLALHMLDLVCRIVRMEGMEEMVLLPKVLMYVVDEAKVVGERDSRDHCGHRQEEVDSLFPICSKPHLLPNLEPVFSAHRSLVNSRFLAPFSFDEILQKLQHFVCASHLLVVMLLEPQLEFEESQMAFHRHTFEYQEEVLAHILVVRGVLVSLAQVQKALVDFDRVDLQNLLDVQFDLLEVAHSLLGFVHIFRLGRMLAMVQVLLVSVVTSAEAAAMDVLVVSNLRQVVQVVATQMSKCAFDCLASAPK